LVSLFLFTVILNPFTHFLPTESYGFLRDCNAIFNGITTCFLILGIFFIKQKQKTYHQQSMLMAGMSSCFFLVSYLAYHSLHGENVFLGTGWIRPVYFFLLISHICLAIVVFPCILFSYFYAWKKKWKQHRTLVHYTAPLWLYVSITGIVVYLFLKSYET